MDKPASNSQDAFKANCDRCRAAIGKTEGGRCRPHDQWQDRAVDLRPNLRDKVSGRWCGAGCGGARATPKTSIMPQRSRPRLSSPGARCPRQCARSCLHRVADAIEDHAEDIALLECIDTGRPIASWPKPRSAAAENFRFFADRCENTRDGLNMPSEEHWNISTPRADRTGRRDHAVEHPVHALDLEDRAGAGRRLHGRA